MTAYDAVIAVFAQLLVPNNEPVIPSVTSNDPLNTAGPIFVNVEDPETVSDPVTSIPSFATNFLFAVTRPSV